MYKVLVVIHDVGVSREICAALRGEGYQAFEGRGFEEAWRYALGFKPDLILCGMDFPGADGSRLVEKLQQNAKTSVIPVVVLGGGGRFRDPRLGLGLGVDACLEAPFAVEDLLVLVRKQREKVQGYRQGERSKLLHCIACLADAIPGTRELDGMGESLDPIPAITKSARAVAERWGRLSDLQLELAEVRMRFKEELMEIVVTELMDNAMKASREGARVIVRLDRVGLDALITVVDEGRGMGEEKQRRLMEGLEFGVSGIRGVDGLGLGLAMVQFIARAFCGEVILYRRPKAGTAVRLRLPVVVSEQVGMTQRLGRGVDFWCQTTVPFCP